MAPVSRLAPNAATESVIPTNYEEFYNLYRDRIRRQVLGFNGIPPQDVDDITNILIMQFIEGDYLNIYSHDRQAQYAKDRYEQQMVEYEAGERTYKPVPLAGKFTSFLFEFVYRRLLGLREKKERLGYREGMSLELLLDNIDDDEDRRVPVALIQLTGSEQGEYYSIELRDLLAKCHALLVQYTVPTPTRNLPQLFQAMCTETFIEDEGFNKRAYAEARGITVSAVAMQQKDLRSFLYSFGLEKDLWMLFVNRSHACHRRTVP